MRKFARALFICILAVGLIDLSVANAAWWDCFFGFGKEGATSSRGGVDPISADVPAPDRSVRFLSDGKRFVLPAPQEGLPNIVMPRSSQVGLLFYSGDLPEPAIREAYNHQGIVYQRNDNTGIVAIICSSMLGHAQIARFVPEGAKILGGTRWHYGFGGVWANSDAYQEFPGPQTQADNFNVSFESPD